MTKFDIKRHTIILAVGPTNSGKTHLITNFLKPQLEDCGMRVVHISSDNIRRRLLGSEDLNKHNTEMMYASNGAFSLLYEEVKQYSSYPINADVIVVDTKGMSSTFRKDILAIAKDNHYNTAMLLLNYDSVRDYYENPDFGWNKGIIANDIRKFRERTLMDLDVKRWNQVLKIRSRDFSEYEFHPALEAPKLSFSKENDYLVIGDIHGRYDLLVDLLNKFDIEVDENKNIIRNDRNITVVSIGDILDKGSEKGIRDCIEFFYRNRSTCMFVRGNHELFVYEYLTEKSLKRELMQRFFQSALWLEKDEEYLKMFMVVFILGYNYIKIGQTIITHAPCQAKYLEKNDSKSVERQNSFRYGRYDGLQLTEENIKDLKKDFEFIYNESNRSLPLHIFGHVAFNKPLRIGKFFCIDTGAVYTDNLTGVLLVNGEISTVKSTKVFGLPSSNVLPISIFKDDNVKISEIDFVTRKAIAFKVNNKINYISGTIAPAPSCKEKMDIESLDNALDYYKNMGLDKVVIQPKYMGSRANVYLFKNIDDSYTVSRNGFVVNRVENLSSIYEKLYKLPYIQNFFENNGKLIIIDGELLPWSALGKGLIEEDFSRLSIAINQEIKFLKESGFDTMIDKLKNTEVTFNNTVEALTKYLPHHMTVEEKRKELSVFDKQLKLYGEDSEIDFKPFSLLKEVYTDDSEKLFWNENNEWLFNVLNEDPCLVVDFSDKDACDKAKAFFDTIVFDKKMEGVMIKPFWISTHDVLPAMKVRNKEYLTLVYGYDFLYSPNYNIFVNQKNVSRKRKLSISEWEYGKRMLNIPYKDISMSNESYVNIAYRLINEIDNETTLDPRL